MRFRNQAKKNNTLVTGNTSDEKNLFFLIDFSAIFSFLHYSLLLFLILLPFAVVIFLLFFELKNVYSDTYSTTLAGE